MPGLAVIGRLFYPEQHNERGPMNQQADKHPVATAQLKGERDYQEDTLDVQLLAADAGPRANELLLVLADGMGGCAGGEIASRLVVDRFCAAYSSSLMEVPDALRSGLEAANESIADAVLDAPKLRGMGSTLVGSVIRENNLYWVSVGDSPLWVCRGGALQRLNADHSLVPLLELMVSSGELTRGELLTDPRRCMLRSALAGETIALVDLCETSFQLEAGDVVMLASDGVETLAEDQLVAVLLNQRDKSLQELADNLMASIDAAGHDSQDNASVILYLH